MNKDKYFMEIAFKVAEASKCKRAKYGAVLVSPDGRIVSTGFNGKPRGAINDNVCYREGLPDNASKPNCCLHSEANCLFFASPEERIGSTLYVSGIPCTDCLLLCMQAQIGRLVFFENADGHKGDMNREFINKYGIWRKIMFVQGKVINGILQFIDYPIFAEA